MAIGARTSFSLLDDCSYAKRVRPTRVQASMTDSPWARNGRKSVSRCSWTRCLGLLGFAVNSRRFWLLDFMGIYFLEAARADIATPVCALQRIIRT